MNSRPAVVVLLVATCVLALPAYLLDTAEHAQLCFHTDAFSMGPFDNTPGGFDVLPLERFFGRDVPVELEHWQIEHM